MHTDMIIEIDDEVYILDRNLIPDRTPANSKPVFHARPLTNRCAPELSVKRVHTYEPCLTITKNAIKTRDALGEMGDALYPRFYGRDLLEENSILCTEYVKGQTLDTKYFKTNAEIIRICELIAIKTAQATDLGVQHLDIKDENIVLKTNPTTNEEVPIFIDLEFMKKTSEPPMCSSTKAPYRYGGIYISPEMHMSQGASLTSDIYSCAEMIATYLRTIWKNWRSLPTAHSNRYQTKLKLEAKANGTYFTKEHDKIAREDRDNIPEGLREKIWGLLEFVIRGLRHNSSARPNSEIYIRQLLQEKPPVSF